jgi:hypothetical protein
MSEKESPKVEKTETESPKVEQKKTESAKKLQKKKDNEDFKIMNKLSQKRGTKLSNSRRLLNFGFGLLTTLLSICKSFF